MPAHANASHSSRSALAWLLGCGAVGLALVFLFLDSNEQDGPMHYLYARWAWRHPENFVGVWARPLFTFLYAFPALLGYQACRLCSVALSLVTAWHTWKLAQFLKLDRAPLAIPLLFFQPAFLLRSFDTMTELLFACLFILALRLHLTGWIKTGALVASLLLLTRPEGFFLGILWGFWLLFDSRAGQTLWRRATVSLLLATGGLLWIAAAGLITGDWLYIKNDWPNEWEALSAAYGRGPLLTYVICLPEIVGPFFLIPFAAGLARALPQRRLLCLHSPFLVLLFLHSLFRYFGLFGSAGYARYFVCVAPAIAILTLVGWNWLAGCCGEATARSGKKAIGLAVILLSGWLSLLYIDRAHWSRDARAAADIYHWWQENPRPVSKLVWSQAYQNILFNRDPAERPAFLYGQREENLRLLRAMPAHTLVFWDADTGPAWYGITASDIAGIGYQTLQSRQYTLMGYVLHQHWLDHGGPRKQEMHLLYKSS